MKPTTSTRASLFLAPLVVLALLLLAVPAGAKNYRVEKLVTDLNHSADISAKARKELVSIGRDAVPRLLEEIRGYVDPTDVNCVRAARAFRVLAEMRSPAGLPLCREILLRFTPTKKWIWDARGGIGPQYVLLGEALRYVYALFEEDAARGIYLQLVLNRTDAWLGSFDVIQYYSGNAHIYKVPVALDVFTGLHLLSRREDPKAGEVLIFLLGKLPYALSEHSLLAELAYNGFQPVVLTRDGVAARLKDSSRRCTIVLLRLLRQHRVMEAVPHIEKLLTHSQTDVRDYALATLEDLTSDEAREKGKSRDEVVLRTNEILRGRVRGKDLTIRNKYAEMTVPLTDVKRLHFATGGHLVELRNGERLLGVVKLEGLTIRLADGKERTLAQAEVESVAFRD